MTDLDPRYVAARNVLLDALVALESHRDAVVVVGAHAVYLQTASVVLATIAPFTVDGDLVLDPRALADRPLLAEAMEGAGFARTRAADGSPMPGVWQRSVLAAGGTFTVPVDLMVPEAVAPPGGRRGARLGVHGNGSARRTVGLEAALVDFDLLEVPSLDPSDSRSVVVQVAGVGALVVAKANKLGDRLDEPRRGRLLDKDASDIYRLLSVATPLRLRETMEQLLANEVSCAVTRRAIDVVVEAFGGSSPIGIEMAERALFGAVDPSTVRATFAAAWEVLGAIEGGG